ncbi:MAG TPA: class I SAM-dependent methyltransferase [Victivallales bacterium]|nr:class I SAM-dependent methyltransferase [Victivallales bacterium]
MKVRDSGMPDETYWESFFKPECLLDNFIEDKISGNIVEFGCGYGTFTIAAAHKTTGNIICFDIEKDMIERTNTRCTADGLNNVITINRDFISNGTGLRNSSVEFVMLFNLLHLQNPHIILREAFRILCKGGKLAVIHWNYDSSTPRGPSLEIRPKPEQCKLWGEKAGFTFESYIDLKCCPYHYGLSLIKTAK